MLQLVHALDPTFAGEVLWTFSLQQQQESTSIPAEQAANRTAVQPSTAECR